MYKIPKTEEKLVTIKSTDSAAQLEKAYNRVIKTQQGGSILAIVWVWDKLTEWISVEEAELLIPINEKPGWQKRGYRIRSLSQERGAKTYAGNWFDIKIRPTTKRKIRVECRLCKEAIRFIGEYRGSNESSEEIISSFNHTNGDFIDRHYHVS